jgi:nicotinamidase/pyrazinamidase
MLSPFHYSHKSLITFPCSCKNRKKFILYRSNNLMEFSKAAICLKEDLIIIKKVFCLEKNYNITSSVALLITDVQKDFLQGGALPVPQGDKIIPVLNEYAKRFNNAGAYIFASRDWHPPNHISFKAQGGPWPPHCVQQTEGAEFSPDLKLPTGTVVISKATDPKRESYSVFDGRDFSEQLKNKGVKRLFVGGLATDYCVVNTVLDALKLGYATVVLMDATLGINVKPSDADRAIEAMIKAGAEQATTADFPDAVDTLPVEEAEADVIEDKPSARAAVKKKARMRPRGSVKRIRTERKG